MVYALSATLPMFIGQNLGANRKLRIASAIKTSFLFVVLFQLLIFLILIVFAVPISLAFSDEIAVQNSIQSFLYIIPVSYGLSAMIILINVAMNVLGKPKLALYINLARLALIYTPLALLGGHLFDLKGIFIGISIGNLIAFGLAFYLFALVLKQHEVHIFNEKNT